MERDKISKLQKKLEEFMGNKVLKKIKAICRHVPKHLKTDNGF